jgi:DNA integrity scanning protein DisA with diadenylate cyclase activity
MENNFPKSLNKRKPDGAEEAVSGGSLSTGDRTQTTHRLQNHRNQLGVAGSERLNPISMLQTARVRSRFEIRDNQAVLYESNAYVQELSEWNGLEQNRFGRTSYQPVFARIHHAP